MNTKTCKLRLVVEVVYELYDAQTEQMAENLQSIVDHAEANGFFTGSTTANVRSLDAEILTLDTPDSHELVLARALVQGNSVPHADADVLALASTLTAAATPS